MAPFVFFMKGENSGSKKNRIERYFIFKGKFAFIKSKTWYSY